MRNRVTITLDFHVKGKKIFAIESHISPDLHVKGKKTFAIEAQITLTFVLRATRLLHNRGTKCAIESQITLDFHVEGEKTFAIESQMRNRVTNHT